jgi:hypothetical protein
MSHTCAEKFSMSHEYFFQIVKILTKKQVYGDEILENLLEHNVKDSKIKSKYGKGSDPTLHALLKELSNPVFNNNNNNR